jgi:hypothetical protein
MACPVVALDVSILKDPGYEGPMAMQVTGISKDTKRETLELFFSNPSKSGGDEVLDIYTNDKTGNATVTFASARSRSLCI